MSYSHNLVFAFVSKRLHEKPATSLGHLSAELGVSHRTIQEIVSEQTGKTFSALRGETLMARVKQLFLSQPGLAIKEASFALGFCSPRSFGRAVKRACGLSPCELRSSSAARRLLKERMDVLPCLSLLTFRAEVP